MSILLGCVEAKPKGCYDCPDDSPNRIIHGALVKKGTVIRTDTAANMLADLLAAERSCNAYIMRNVNGTKADPTFAEGPGQGKQTSRVQAASHTISYMEFNYANTKTVEWYNYMIDAAANFYLIYFTEGKAWFAGRKNSAGTFVGAPVKILPKDPITDDNTTFITAMIDVSWNQKGNPVPYEADDDGLSACALLFDYDELAGIANQSGSEATVVGETITVDVDGLINVQLDTGVTLDSVEVVEGTLPDGVSVSINTDVVVIGGNPTETGTFEVTISAANACGVAGQFTVTIVVE